MEFPGGEERPVNVDRRDPEDLSGVDVGSLPFVFLSWIDSKSPIRITTSIPWGG
jgi:hypothetical protein